MDKKPLVSQTGRTRSVYGSPGQTQRGPDLSGVSSGGQIQQQQAERLSLVVGGADTDHLRVHYFVVDLVVVPGLSAR